MLPLISYNLIRHWSYIKKHYIQMLAKQGSLITVILKDKLFVTNNYIYIFLKKI